MKILKNVLIQLQTKINSKQTWNKKKRKWISQEAILTTRVFGLVSQTKKKHLQ